jgi:two-component system, OmpR family, alkaline phosphatase synthesis response regulator PhoP
VSVVGEEGATADDESTVPYVARRPVLVVDDEPHIARIIATRLTQGPFDVTLASGGQAACDRLASDEPFALLVLDLMMPDVSGFDVLHAARRDPRRSRLPCIVLTAMGQDSVAHGLATLGISEFMTKPFSPRRLYARALALTDAAYAPTGRAYSPEEQRP